MDHTGAARDHHVTGCGRELLPWVGRFSPMVFLGRAVWTERMPVRAVLAALLDPADFRDRVLFTDDEVEAAEFVNRGGASGGVMNSR